MENWYAIYTKPRWEKKVAGSLSQNGIDNYCPLNKVVRQWSDRKKIVEEPLFTSYVFVKINSKRHTELRKIDGIVNFVYWLGRPAIIRDEEIETIKQFLNEYLDVKLERAPVNVQDRVRIINGPLIEMEGKVVAVKKKTIRVVLPSLGYMMTAEIERENVKVVKRGVF
jgi:transcription antitermination factor NusG